jgi:hypothetical protein
VPRLLRQILCRVQLKTHPGISIKQAAQAITSDSVKADIRFFDKNCYCLSNKKSHNREKLEVKQNKRERFFALPFILIKANQFALLNELTEVKLI